MEVEINENFVEKNNNIKSGNAILMITPPLNEDYWVFRVHCRTKTIFNHIKHNKKYKEITDDDCIKAIEMLREQCRIFKDESLEYFKSEENRIDGVD